MGQTIRIIHDSVAKTVVLQLADLPGTLAELTYDDATRLVTLPAGPVSPARTAPELDLVLAGFSEFFAVILRTYPHGGPPAATGDLEVRISADDENQVLTVVKGAVSRSFTQTASTGEYVFTAGPVLILTIPEFHLMVNMLLNWVALMTRNPGWLTVAFP